jgi:phage shock protein PspC (stress-responsive transcriptional regulator)/GNAT superfamily N-acetyltransferase
MITTRKATTADISLINELATEAFPYTYREILTPEQIDYMMDWMYSPESLRRQMEEEGHHYYLIYKDGQAAGYVSIQQEGDDLFHLQKIYVLPAFWKDGLGRRLFEVAVNAIRDLHPTPCRMELNVNRHNPARGFYEHMGITVENVEAVIERMGKPEQLDEETPESESSAGTRREERPRRLFRDPDDRVLGGVASGLAAYFNWDPMWVRIALILLAIPVHGLILVYLIAWIVIPVAHTATEKLQMHGRTISMENIGRTVTDSFERVNDYVRSDKPRSILHRIGSGIVQMVGLLMRLVLILIAICLAPVLFAGIVTVFALIMAATGILISVPAFVYNAFPYINWELVASSSGIGRPSTAYK